MTAVRLHRSVREKMVFGVAGGLAEYFNTDPVLIRLAFVLLSFMGGAGILIYLVLALIMPREGSESAEPYGVMRENLNELTQEAAEAGRRAQDALRPNASGAPPSPPPHAPPPSAAAAPETLRSDRANWSGRGPLGLGLILVALGIIFLLDNLGFLYWFQWRTFWPLALILLGVLLMISRARRT